MGDESAGRTRYELSVSSNSLVPIVRFLVIQSPLDVVFAKRKHSSGC